MYTMIYLGGISGIQLEPITVAANEKFNGVHDFTMTIPEAYAPDLELGMPILLSWLPDVEFILMGMDIDNNICDLRCSSTEAILSQRPAVPDVRSTTWKDAEYPDGWVFGDEYSDVPRQPIRDVLTEVWDKSTKWYQNSGFNAGARDVTADLTADFTRGVTGNLISYNVDGSLLDVVQDLLARSTTRVRLRTTRQDTYRNYRVGFYTEPCRDRVREISMINFRTDVKSIRTSIDISDSPSVIVRSNEDVVMTSRMYHMPRNYVTMKLVEASDDDYGEGMFQQMRNQELVYEPYSSLTQGYSVEFEFHGALDLSDISPGDTVTTDSNHPRPSWITDELMVTEIVRTKDHLGYREYPLLTSVPASDGRDNAASMGIRNSIRTYNAN